MKIAFVTDTGTGQHPDYWKEKGIYCLPLQTTCDGESKDEYTEITYSEVIQKLHEKKVLKTSLPSLGKIQDCFEKLKHEGYEVSKAFDGREGLEMAQSGSFDLILLDIMLPLLNGLEVLRRIRKMSEVPVIMLTARDAVMDKVSGLDAGADDYITKPFAIEELLARIRVALKKSKAAGGKEEHRIEVNQVILDDDRHEVSCHGERIELTHREYELLKVLMQNKNIVMDREKLLNLVCGYDYAGETNIIDVYIRYIRAKVDDRFGIKLITTVRSVGYLSLIHI